MDRKEYCDRVLAQVGRLTTDEANDLRNELAIAILVSVHSLTLF